MQNLFKNRKFRIFLQWLILILLVGILAYTLYQITSDVAVLKRRGFFSVSYRHRLFAIHRAGGQLQASEIQAWMSFRYVNLVFGLPSAYLKTELSISDPHYPNMSIGAAAKNQKKTYSEELLLVQQAVQSQLSIQPTATTTTP